MMKVVIMCLLLVFILSGCQPTVSDYVLMGQDYLSKGDNIAAIESFSSAVAMDPESYEPYMGLGMANYNLKRYDSAIAFFSRVLELKSGDDNIYYFRGLSYYGVGKYDLAIADLNKVSDESIYPGLCAIVEDANRILKQREEETRDKYLLMVLQYDKEMIAQGYVLYEGDWMTPEERAKRTEIANRELWRAWSEDEYSNYFDDSRYNSNSSGFGAFLTLPPGGYRDNGYTTPVAPSTPQFPSLPPNVPAPAGGWGNVPSQGSDVNSFWLPNK